MLGAFTTISESTINATRRPKSSRHPPRPPAPRQRRQHQSTPPRAAAAAVSTSSRVCSRVCSRVQPFNFHDHSRGIYRRHEPFQDAQTSSTTSSPSSASSSTAHDSTSCCCSAALAPSKISNLWFFNKIFNFGPSNSVFEPLGLTNHCSRSYQPIITKI